MLITLWYLSELFCLDAAWLQATIVAPTEHVADIQQEPLPKPELKPTPAPIAVDRDALVSEHAEAVFVSSISSVNEHADQTENQPDMLSQSAAAGIDLHVRPTGISIAVRMSLNL